MPLPAWNKAKTKSNAKIPFVVIGMIHLRPLPGSPRSADPFRTILAAALRDAHTLAAGGVHALMMENFGDVPFFPGRVPAEVVAHMTAVAAEIRRQIPLPLGINVLRNDGLSALAIAAATGAEFIRVNVLCGARVTDQGVIQGIAHDLLRLRQTLGANVKIFADVDVKHSAPLAPRPLADEVADTLERGLADALVVSGAGTGKPTDAAKVRTVQAAAPHAPVFVGSGVTPATIHHFFDTAAGAIVGTSLKTAGRPENPVDPKRVKALMQAATT